MRAHSSEDFFNASPALHILSIPGLLTTERDIAYWIYRTLGCEHQHQNRQCCEVLLMHLPGNRGYKSHKTVTLESVPALSKYGTEGKGLETWNGFSRLGGSALHSLYQQQIGLTLGRCDTEGKA